MGRRKKTSAILQKAQIRLAGLRSIDGKLDLGHGVSTPTFGKQVDGLRQTIDNYNSMLSTLDDLANAIEKEERELAIASENVLLSVKVKFGKDSSEYEMVGGTRLSDRRRPRRRSEPLPEPTPA